MSDFSLVFLTRSGCHLCAVAEPVVRRVASEFGAAVEVVDIDDDPDLQARYTTRVPVVLGPSGRVLAEGVVDERRLRIDIDAERARMAF